MPGIHEEVLRTFGDFAEHQYNGEIFDESRVRKMIKNRWWMITLSIVSAFILILLGRELSKGLVASAATSDSTVFYFPIVMKNYTAVSMNAALTGDLNRQPKDEYYIDDPITYISSGVNNISETVSVNLNWIQTNNCGTTEIFTDSVNLHFGEWTHAYTSTIPVCAGTYTNTVTMIYGDYSKSLVTIFEVLIPPVELTDAWTGDGDQQAQDVFFFGDPISYITEGINNLGITTTVDLSWIEDGPCGSSEIYSDTLYLSSGVWMHVYTSTAPSCAGTITGTAQISTDTYSTSRDTIYDGRFPSGIVINTQQAFDKCALPTVGQMQTWWDESPYVVHNIYIGGIHYACPTGTLNASWMQAVAQQGWAFILTWVGPQAPCTGYTHKISYNTSTAYSQGIDEAAAALDASESIGISGEKILYYDMESYAGADSSCRNAVDAFLAGWTDWIRLQGDKAGVYGSPCYYMMDWWSNDLEDRPDDVWIASWLTPAEYRPDATVWNVACMNNTYWPGQQRLRQYAGGHVEAWGGVTFSIDSNVLNGEITAITTTLPGLKTAFEPSVTASSFGKIQDIDLVSPNFGWVLQDNRLQSTLDGGLSWNDLTLEYSDFNILDVEFLNDDMGWLVIQSAEVSPDGNLTILQTWDGGFTWKSSTYSLGDPRISTAHLNFIDSQTGWLVVKLPTSSNFSIGRLFATQDGGQTWEERTIPIGEQIRFIDGQHGWVAGGPSGDQLFYTQDGGRTWMSQPLTNLPDGQILVGLPEFDNPEEGFLPVTVLDTQRSSLALYKTENSGDTWILLDSVVLDAEPGTALPFSLANGDWWVAAPDFSGLISSQGPENSPTNIASSSLLQGVILLDFSTEKIGWALVQNNSCQGDKIPFRQTVPESAAPFRCRLTSVLLVTQDGGLNWTEITP